MVKSLITVFGYVGSLKVNERSEGYRCCNEVEHGGNMVIGRMNF